MSNRRPVTSDLIDRAKNDTAFLGNISPNRCTAIEAHHALGHAYDAWCDDVGHPYGAVEASLGHDVYTAAVRELELWADRILEERAAEPDPDRDLVFESHQRLNDAMRGFW